MIDIKEGLNMLLIYQGTPDQGPLEASIHLMKPEDKIKDFQEDVGKIIDQLTAYYGWSVLNKRTRILLFTAIESAAIEIGIPRRTASVICQELQDRWTRIP